MAWSHRRQQTAKAKRDMTLARTAAKRMQSAGIPAEVRDIRDVFGARFDPCNLLVLGEIRVLVRCVGYKPHPTNQDSLRVAAGDWLQCGASAAALAPLIERCRALMAQPWPTNPQTRQPLLLKR